MSKEQKLTWASIGQGPFQDHAEETPQLEISSSEARDVLGGWARVATYNLPRRTVVEMLERCAEELKQS